MSFILAQLVCAFSPKCDGNSHCSYVGCKCCFSSEANRLLSWLCYQTGLHRVWQSMVKLVVFLDWRVGDSQRSFKRSSSSTILIDCQNFPESGNFWEVAKTFIVSPWFKLLSIGPILSKASRVLGIGCVQVKFRKARGRNDATRWTAQLDSEQITLLTVHLCLHQKKKSEKCSYISAVTDFLSLSYYLKKTPQLSWRMLFPLATVFEKPEKSYDAFSG